MGTLVSVNPRTGETVGSVETTPPERVAEVVVRARRAFEAWSGTPIRERLARLRGFKRLILDRGDEVAETVAAETGKDPADAYLQDVLVALNVVAHYVRRAERYLEVRSARTWPFVTTAAATFFRPRGVAGVISPWNYPFLLPMIPTVSALAAGCTVVLKPSEVTPLTGELIGRLADEAGLGTDVVSVIQGGGDVGSALVEADVDVLSFTGSTAVGRRVAEAAGRRLIPVILELGGNDAMLVLEDADLGRAARAAAWGATLVAGQTCVAVERVYVVDEVYDEFLSALESQFDRLNAGGGDRWDVGPIITEAQLGVVERHVADAVERGAKVLRGGHRVETKRGRFYAPTLVVDVPADALMMTEETFGPVLPVVRVADEDEAVAAANSSAYGLHGSVWTADKRRGVRVARRLRTGTVAVNDVAVNFATPGIPFGGVGLSGVGVALGPEGIRAYCHPQGVTVSRLGVPTTQLVGAALPRRGLRYWKALGRLLYRW